MNELMKEFNEISFEIKNDNDVSRLTLILRRIKECIQKVCDKLDPEIANAHKTHKSLNALKKETLKPFEDAELKINQSLKQWTLKKEEEARLLQQIINEQLAKQAEEERKRLLKEAKDDWQKEVANEKIDEINVQTVELKECIKAVEVKQEGQYKRSNWKAKVVDENKIPRQFLIPNMELLNKFAKEHKENFGIPGVEAYDDFTIVTKI